MSETKIRVAVLDDLDGICRLVDEFAQSHPSKDHKRPKDLIQQAYFGDNPSAEIIIAERNGDIIGMIQWNLMFDMFWCIYHGFPEWYYVSSRFRGSGICFSLFAYACSRIREKGGVAVYAFANENTYKLLDRITYGGGSNSFYHLSCEAFHQIADLAGRHPKEIIRLLPSKELNKVERR